MSITELLHFILNWQMIIICCVCVYFFLRKDTPALLFSLVTLVSFLLSYIFTPIVFELDPNYVYRYIFWVFNDILWMAVIAFLAIKDKINVSISVMAQIAVIPAILMQLFRIVDIHILEISFISMLYKSIIPLSNSIIVLLCIFPLLSYIVGSIKLFVYKMADAS